MVGLWQRRSAWQHLIWVDRPPVRLRGALVCCSVWPESAQLPHPDFTQLYTAAALTSPLLRWSHLNRRTDLSLFSPLHYLILLFFSRSFFFPPAVASWMLPTGAAEGLTVESLLSLSLVRPDLCQGPCHTHTCTDSDTHTCTHTHIKAPGDFVEYVRH